MSTQDFEELRKHWYQILRDDGFKDIEQLNGTLRQGASVAHRDHKGVSAESKEEYFRRLGHKVHNKGTKFKTIVDRHILSRHAEGATIQRITEELTELGVSRDRRTVRFIIRRYVMKWKIRTFTRKQLDRK